MPNISATLSLNVPAITALCKGEAGNSILNGDGAPTSLFGSPGDFYIDTSTYNIYGPKVSSNWGTPTTLTVSNSADIWNAAYTFLQSNSAKYNSNYNTVNTLSSRWTSTHNSVSSLSSNWKDGNLAYTAYNSTSAAIQSMYCQVTANSAYWQAGGDISSGSRASDWNSVYDTVYTLSATSWDNTSLNTAVTPNSARWNSSYTTVNSNSATWRNAASRLSETSGAWNYAYNSISLNVAPFSGDWNSTYNNSYYTSGRWESAFSTVRANSAVWNAGSVDPRSDSWDATTNDVNSNVKPFSANWQSTYDYVRTVLSGNEVDAFGMPTKVGNIVLSRRTFWDGSWNAIAELAGHLYLYETTSADGSGRNWPQTTGRVWLTGNTTNSNQYSAVNSIFVPWNFGSGSASPATCRVFVTMQLSGGSTDSGPSNTSFGPRGTPGVLYTCIIPNRGFTICSTSMTDKNLVNWTVVQPNSSV